MRGANLDSRIESILGQEAGKPSGEIHIGQLGGLDTVLVEPDPSVDVLARACSVAASRRSVLVIAGDVPEPVSMLLDDDALTKFVGLSGEILRVAVGPAPTSSLSAAIHRAAEFSVVIGTENAVRPDSLADGASEAVRLVEKFLNVASGRLPSRVVEQNSSSVIERLPFDIDTAYDVRRVVLEVLDDGSLLEYGQTYGPEILTGLGQVGGRTVGVIANVRSATGSRVGGEGWRKIVRLLGVCRETRMPTLVLVDVDGFTMRPDMAIVDDLAQVAALLRSDDAKLVVLITGRAAGHAAAVVGTFDSSAHTTAWPKAEIIRSVPSDIEFGCTPIHSGKSRAVNGIDVARLGGLLDVIHPDDTRSVLVESISSLYAESVHEERYASTSRG